MEDLMAQLDRAALLMSQDDLHSALDKQVKSKLDNPKPKQDTHDSQTAPDSPLVDDFSLMPYEMAEIQESSQSFDQALENGEEESVAAAHLWDEPTKNAES
jgi:hypothetical protein